MNVVESHCFIVHANPKLPALPVNLCFDEAAAPEKNPFSLQYQVNRFSTRKRAAAFALTFAKGAAVFRRELD
jgi:hypothetical protein